MRAALGTFLLSTVLLAGCSATSAPAGPTSPVDATAVSGLSPACDAAFAAAAAVGPMEDTVADLYPVILACRDLADFQAGWEKFDAVGFAGTATGVLEDACGSAPREVQDSAICRAVM
jgi:hypothetical protein